MQIVFTDGLGNEMFQYALYLAMRHKGRKPKINIGIISRNVVHNGFELCEDFEIKRDSLNLVDGGRIGGGLVILAKRYLKGLCYEEDINHYSDSVFSTHRPIVNGYWQNERYFFNIAEDVRKAFTFRNIDQINKALGAKMASCQSVSVHIRRGDYLKYPNLQVCTPSYYRRAIKFIKEKVKEPVFYVFSDDLKWSDELMKELGVDYQIVSHNRGKESYKDMYLMTQCKHNIIANSSFSWWGAWLAEKEGKIIVCPSEWIKGKHKDPCPKRWARVSPPPKLYQDKKPSLLSIIIDEYKNLKTGKKPVVVFAVAAYYRSDSFKLTVMIRRMQSCKSKFLKSHLSHILIRKYSVEVSSTAIIGKGFRIHHIPGIVIGTYAIIGNNCNIFQGVLLGQKNGIFPTIGNNVTLYPYCAVLGDVYVGDNSVVSAHAVVTHDVPPNCMVAGNPARIIKYFK